MKQLKQMKESLTAAVQSQMTNLAQANTEELGAAIDMIKDLSEAIYYCTITESMKEAAEEKEEMMKMQKYAQQNGNGGNQQQQQQQPQVMYFQERIREPYPMMRDIDRDQGRMYYNGDGGSSGGGSSGGSGGNSGSSGRGGGSSSGSRNYSEPTYMNQRDWREGRSPERRRTYMESKTMNSDKTMHMRELENYAQELMTDILEMINDATPEEKQLMKKKMTDLANKL